MIMVVKNDSDENNTNVKDDNDNINDNEIHKDKYIRDDNMDKR